MLSWRLLKTQVFNGCDLLDILRQSWAWMKQSWFQSSSIETLTNWPLRLHLSCSRYQNTFRCFIDNSSIERQLGTKNCHVFDDVWFSFVSPTQIASSILFYNRFFVDGVSCCLCSCNLVSVRCKAYGSIRGWSCWCFCELMFHEVDCYTCCCKISCKGVGV